MLNCISLKDATALNINEIFELQVKKHPHAIAAIYNNHSYSYQELNDKSNRLAHLLSSKYKIKNDEIIAIYLDRSVNTLIAILSILKAGAAYVPIDPNHPQERISHILHDSKTRVVITTTSHSLSLIDICTSKRIKCEALVVDHKDIIEQLAQTTTESLTNTHSVRNLAYILYTSGTTGTPKAVMVEHINVVSLIYANFIEQSRSFNTILLSDLSFDATVLEIYLPLLTGGYVYIPSSIFELLSDTNSLKQILTQYSINVLWLTKSLFDTLFLIDEQLFSSVDTLILGGEALNPKLVNKLITSPYSPTTILNGYGPTENTTFSCIHKITNQDITSIPIGKAIAGRYAYVLNNQLEPLTDGTIGELYLAGLGIARGYLNTPQLTTQKFIPNPFQTDEQKQQGINDRLYQTGDLARILPDGSIDFIGRDDTQIKIRGYRVELSEIDRKLTEMANISYAISILKENQLATGISNKFIISFFIATDNQQSTEVLSRLKSQLPEYMVPAYLIPIKRVPLTTNGKLDKASLLSKFESYTTINNAQPANHIENTICGVFAATLGIKQDKIAIDDSLFTLGGNSITAIQIVAQINKTFPHIQITIKNILTLQSIRSIANFIANSSPENNRDNFDKLLDEKIEEYPLSSQQKSLWAINELQDIAGAYQITLCGKIVSCSIETINKVFKQLLLNNEIFRTQIKYLHGTLVQSIVPLEKVNWQIIIKECCNGDELIKFVSKDMSKKFILESELPLRAYIYSNLSNQQQYLVCQIHHIALDGYSLKLLQNEINYIYKYINNLESLMPKQWQYRHYAYWQNHHNFDYANDLAYWKEELADLETLNLATDFTRPQLFDYQGKSIDFTVDLQCSNNLRQIANQLGVSLFSVLLSAYQLLMYTFANQSNFGIGIPYINRDEKNHTHEMIGFFINTLVIKFEKHQQISVADFIILNSRKIISAINHSNISFEELVDTLQVPRDVSRNPLFQTMFSLQQFTPENWQSDFLAKDHVTKLINQQNQYAIFDILTILDDSLPEITGYFNYATSIFSESTIREYINTYQLILNEFSNVLSVNNFNLADINYISHDYYIQLTQHSSTPIPLDNTTIIDRFQELVKLQPEKIALNFAGKNISYVELEQISNHLASYLISNLTIKEGSIIAIHLSRSDFMVACIIAILKTGAGYLPIDKNSGQSLINFILDDSEPLALISDAPIANNTNIKIITPEELLTGVTSGKSSAVNNSTTSQLAYLLYTSGTTGKPKGVLMEMRGLMLRINEMIRYSSLNTTTKYLFKTNYIFDVSFSDIFTTLCAGGTLYISQDIFDINEIVTLTQNHQINTIHFVPTQIALVKDLFLDNQLPSITTINVSGEGFSKTILTGTNFAGKVINYYGPTETGEVSYEITDYSLTDDQNKNLITIGYPIAGSTLWILNNELKLLPKGAIGELYISGVSLAKGYHKLNQLTQDKFIDNPHSNISQAKSNSNKLLHKTGDIVRMLRNGNIEYIGRNDSQVKLNGIRIELSEIENLITTFDGIQQTIVRIITGSDDNKYLIAYYVSAHEVDASEILNFLAKYLPQSMIPSKLIFLSTIPLTANGKLDANALPQVNIDSLSEYEAPHTTEEKQCCEIFAEILHKPVENISVTSDFFIIGGNSVLAIKLTYLLNTRLGYNFKAFDIFHKKTIRNLMNNVNHEFIEYDDYYEYKNNNLIPTYETLIFIPGCEPGFERNYEHIIKQLDKTNKYRILMLKSKFITYDNIKLFAKYYAQVIEKNNFTDFGKLTLLGFSAGGEIAYFISKILEAKLSIKLIIFDSYMNHDSFYSFIRYYTKKILRADFDEHHWHYKIPQIKSKILFFKASLQQPRKVVIAQSAKLRLLRQIKANFEHALTVRSYNKGNINNLKPHMKFYNIININSYHNGADGIMSAENSIKLSQHIQDFIDNN